jgi:hypothetical protein
VVNFTPRPLYPRGMSHRYSLDRRLGGPQSRSERGGEGSMIRVGNENCISTLAQGPSREHTTQ